MRRNWVVILFLVPALLQGMLATPALAQQGQQQGTPPTLVLFTNYPARVVERGVTVNLNLTLRLEGTGSQTVRLGVEGLPEGWTATFRGGGDVIQAVYVEPGSDALASLRVEPPQDVSAGTYRFVVTAIGEEVTATLPVELTVAERLPPRLEFDVDLPTLRGTPASTFRYDVTLSNRGDEDLTVSLTAQTPEGFAVTFRLSGQEVTSLPLGADESKRLSIEVRPLAEVAAGDYSIVIVAQGGEAQATASLVAEVTGQPDLLLTTPGERLSFQAYAGRETSLKILIQNNGTAPARDVNLSASEPSGWSVAFEVDRIAEIPAGQQVEVALRVRPSDKAVAGDYMLTLYARPEGGGYESADFRATVLTSTLWGVVGVVLIAVAVGVVALAVIRFGRR